MNTIGNNANGSNIVNKETHSVWVNADTRSRTCCNCLVDSGWPDMSANSNKCHDLIKCACGSALITDGLIRAAASSVSQGGLSPSGVTCYQHASDWTLDWLTRWHYTPAELPRYKSVNSAAHAIWPVRYVLNIAWVVAGVNWCLTLVNNSIFLFNIDDLSR